MKKQIVIAAVWITWLSFSIPAALALSVLDVIGDVVIERRDRRKYVRKRKRRRRWKGRR